MVLISASILSADFAHLEEDVKRAENAGADMIHIDVMDGRFVPNITIGPPVVRSIRDVTELPFDVHLMIVEPERYLEDFANAGADLLTVHQEVSPHLDRTLHAIEELGIKPGVALNPHTPVQTIKHVSGFLGGGDRREPAEAHRGTESLDQSTSPSTLPEASTLPSTRLTEVKRSLPGSFGSAATLRKKPPSAGRGRGSLTGSERSGLSL
ncbi:hypothetical protein B6U83_04900 [Thermoplasmatales archaeon ex4484_36]|nr:MAG: hypothetical protein B6U83_04900 [Thermoplasmatales archaeon ex4484_36]